MTDAPPPGFDPDILSHYRRYEEASRLQTGDGLLEFLRTQELILRHIGPAPLTIADVGGGPGVYSVWLTGRGHRVHLVEPVPEHVDQAEAAAASAGVTLDTAVVGDARDLPLEDATADVVLLLGPLYHLQDPADRLRALGEAQRVLRPGGLLFAAAISRFAPPIDSLWSGWIDDPMFRPWIDRVLTTSRHHNPTDNVAYFTTSYYHGPDDLEAEVSQAGFTGVTVYPVESVAWAARDIDERLRDPERREHLLHVVRLLEREPAVLGASPHLLAIGRSPAG